MKIPFRFRPQLFNTCFVAAEASLGSDVGAVSPGADSVIADQGDSSAPAETSVAPEGVVAGSYNDTGEAQQEVDVFEGVPSLEQLQTEAQQKVPYSEALLRLRTELERVKPLEKQFEPWKPVIETNDPAKVQERLTGYDSIFSPKLENGQPLYDERGLPQTTAQPFLESMEAKRPGYAMDHFLDVLNYEALNPATGQREPLIGQFFREVLGLDANRIEQYQNIDSLIAKTNGNITPEELNAVPEADRDAYKTLPASIRKDWEVIDDEEKRYHLETAKERIESRQFRETQQQAQQKAEQDHRQQFEAQVQQDFTQRLTESRDHALSSLRDNLAKVLNLSADSATNQDRLDDILAPFESLIDPDLQPRALARLEREGIKFDVETFNNNMRTYVKSLEVETRALAHKDTIAADQADIDANRALSHLMAQCHTIAGKRAERYGYQAQKIAQKNGELLTTASQIRPTVPGSSAQQQFSASGLPAGMDPRSSEAAMLQFKQSQGQAG